MKIYFSLAKEKVKIMSNQSQVKFLNKGISKPKIIGVILIFAIMAGGFILWQHTNISKIKINLDTTKLAEVPEGYFLTYDFIFSPDGRKVAYVTWKEKEESNSKKFVMLNNQKGKEYDQITELKFSPDGQHLAYIAMEEDKMFLVLDDKECRAYDLAFSLDFDSDGNPIYLAKNGEGLITDGEYNWRGEAFLVIGEEEQKKYDDIEMFCYDNKHFYYIAKEGGKEKFVIDGAEGKDYDSIIDFDGDAQHYIYGAGEGENRFVIVNGEEKFAFTTEDCTLDYTSVECRNGFAQEFGEVKSVYISPDGSHFAYIENKSQFEFDKYLFLSSSESYLVIDEKQKFFINTGDGHGIYAYPGTGIDNIAYKKEHSFVVKNQEIKLIIDDEEIEEYFVEDFIFSPDNQHYAFTVITATSEKVLILDGKIHDYGVDCWRFGFSPDSNQIFYFKNGETILYNIEKEQIIDTVTGKVEFAFSPNNKHFAYILDKNGKFSLVLDEKEGRVYDKIMSVGFTADNKVIYYGAIINKELWWIADGV